MRAVGLESFEEGPRVLDLPVPQPGPGEILVKVGNASINGFDVMVAAGAVKDYMEHRFPVVLGKDFAGTVEAIGDGVSSVKPGDAVLGVLARDYVGDGTFAEYVVVPSSIGVVKVPAGLDPVRAGALGLAGTAAHDAITAVAPTTGDSVLISGATGGVGAVAIQLSRRRGATVIATARPGEEAQFVSKLGADHTVDYTRDLGPQIEAIAPGGVDAAIHLAGDGPALASLVRAGGRFASTLGIGADQLANQDVQATAVMATPTPGVLNDLATLAAGGSLDIPVARTYKLDEVPDAIKDFGRGTLGKFGVSLD